MTLDSGIGLILVLVIVVATALGARSWSWRRPGRHNLARIAIPVCWFGVAFVVLAVSHNQDVRYLAPGTTGLAVLAAGAVVAIRPRTLQVGVLSVAVVALSWQFVTFIAPFPSTGSITIAAGPTSFPLVLPLAGTQLDYTRRPGAPDDATPVVQALANALARLAPHRGLTVCLLESQAVINGNTLGFVAETRGVPLVFIDLSFLPHVTGRTLAADLSNCQTALYISGPDGIGRVGILNASSAAAQITPAERAQFHRFRADLPVGDGLHVQLLERSA